MLKVLPVEERAAVETCRVADCLDVDVDEAVAVAASSVADVV